MTRWDVDEMKALLALRAEGLERKDIAAKLGRSLASVKSCIGRNLTSRQPARITPAVFARRCQEIVDTMNRHEAHQALDGLSNDVLRERGFGDGVAIFEAAVAGWHDPGQPYPATVNPPALALALDPTQEVAG